MSILILAEHEAGALRPATLSVVAAAQAIGGDVDVLVAGQNAADVANAAAQVAGVSKVLHCDDAHFGYHSGGVRRYVYSPHLCGQCNGNR